jgi:hypothetical protein
LYTVGVINQVSARTSYLYTLIHWVELALRASLDCALSERFGADWHLCNPPVYLNARGLGDLWKDFLEFQKRQAERGWTSERDQPRVKWDRDPVSLNCIPRYDSPEQFLEALDFQPVADMVLYTYEIRAPRVAPILFTRKGDQMPFSSAKAELEWVRGIVRNAVMHNRADSLSGFVFDLDDFVKTATRVERVLRSLRYHTAPALARHELKRWDVVDAAVMRSENRGLAKLIAEVRAGTA